MRKVLRLRGIAVFASCALALAASCVMLAGVAGATTLTTPTISGTAQEGQTLTVTQGTPGPAGDTFTITDQWLVCTATAVCTNGPTGGTFTLTSAEVGATIEVAETANDTVLTPPAPNPVTVKSAATAAVLPLPPANTTAPSITGIVQQGQPLTANPGAWNPGATTYSYAWTSGGVSVGTNSQTYTPVLTDVGKAIAVSVTASNTGGNSAAVGSAPTTAVLPLAPTNITPPSLPSGPIQQGQVLTLTQGTWTSNPIAPTFLIDQWERCTATSCSPIPGQSQSTYTVGADDVGHTIEVFEYATNLAAPPPGVLAVSQPTATVTTTSTTSLVAYTQNSPTTNQAVTLVATVSSNSGNANLHGTLSFFNGTQVIPGCGGKGVSGGQTITIVCQAGFPAGVAQISATYVPDPGSLVGGSGSDTTDVAVGKGPTSVSLAVTPKVAPGGQATFVATVFVPVSNSGPILPGGSIAFFDSGQPISGCASQALSNLTATCTVSYAKAGTHNISAAYNGDSNFTSSGTPASSVQVVAGAPVKPTVHPPLGSTLGWRVYYHPHYSELIELEAFAVAKGTSILVQCYGKSCPFKAWHLRKPAGTINLLSRFRHRHLRAGTRVTVRMTRPHWVGKYYSFTIVAGGAPRVRTTCLAPGSVKPGVGCTTPST